MLIFIAHAFLPLWLLVVLVHGIYMVHYDTWPCQLWRLLWAGDEEKLLEFAHAQFALALYAWLCKMETIETKDIWKPGSRS